MRKKLGQEIASRVRNGDVIGVGTGSTVDVAIAAIGDRVRNEGLKLCAYTTSFESIRRCHEAGIRVLDSRMGNDVDWGFDGADAVDMKLRAIKGGGGALLREKILACRCRSFVIIADEEKLADNIAAKFTVPVEVVPEALHVVEKALPGLGAVEITLRKSAGQYGPVITAFGNMILDVRFREVCDSLERDIKAVTGVVENGLFLTQVTELLLGTKDGVRSYFRS